MTTQICIDARNGQDCLTFSQTGQGPSKSWRFDHVESFTTNSITESSNFQSTVDSAGPGLYYVNQSAHGLMV